jgi:shikimate kinase
MEKGRPSTSSGKTGQKKFVRPIALVGMPGAGKTTVGRLLAALLELPFHDTDEIVVAETGRTIHDIFFAEGPGFFRTLERNTLTRLATAPPSIIATGGGAMIEPETRILLLSATLTIWLDAAPESLAHRLSSAPPRPLLSGPGLTEKLAAMTAERRPLYAAAALRIDASGTPEAVAADVIKALANQ